MKNLDLIAEELFNKIRGRFPSVTLGDGEGKVTNVPTDARFFDFDYKEGDINLGKVSVSLGENSVEIMYSDSFVSEQDEITKQNWYNFLKEIRQFSKKRLMTFDTRNINKSNLDKRDYKFLAQNRGEETMSESKMYGTNRVSYQKVDGARIVVKHNESINADIAGGRTRSIGKIYIESADGERFMYPFKHLSGARAMARHVAEGGKPFDEFGTHIVGLSEEMNKLRKFKSYMGRSAVMAESLAGYTSVVNDRIKSVKKTIESLQKSNYYAEAIGSFEASVMEDVPADVKENWIDQLTIKQFNEELSDVFPYIYKLVSEATKAKELSATDILGEGPVFTADMDDAPQDVDGASAPATSPRPRARPADLGNTQAADSYVVKPGDTIWSIADRFADSNYDGDTKAGAKDILELNGITDPRSLKPGQRLEIGYFMGDMSSGGTRGLPPGGFKSYESQLEDSFDEMMGQFAESKDGDVEEETAVEEQKTPVTEFVLSMFDRETGQFPKGETAILTAIEKDYGEQYINTGKAFIEAINAKYEELNVQRNPIVDDFGFEETGTVMEPTVEQDEEIDERGIDEVTDDRENEFPKIRNDLRKTKNGIPHVGLEYANGDMWYLPVAKDGNPVFTNSEIKWNDLLRRQLAAKGVGFPRKYDGEYGKRAGQWMSQGDMWDMENEAQANSPLAKAEKENIAALKAAGVDWDAALADAEAGNVPDKRIQDADDLMGYLLQKNGIEDATPDRYQISGFGWDENDDGYTFKDTSWFVKKGSGDAGNDSDSQSGNPALDMLRQRQADRSTTQDKPSNLGPTADPIIPNDDAGTSNDDGQDAGTDTATSKPEPEEPSITMPDGSKISGVRNTTTKKTATQRSGTRDIDDVEADVDAGWDELDDVERVRRQGQANVDRVAKQGRDNINRIRKLAGLN